LVLDIKLEKRKVIVDKALIIQEKGPVALFRVVLA